MVISNILRSGKKSTSPQQNNRNGSEGTLRHKRSASLKSFLLNTFSTTHHCSPKSKELYRPSSPPIPHTLPNPYTISDPIPISRISIDDLTPQPTTNSDQLIAIRSMRASFSNIVEESDVFSEKNSIIPSEIGRLESAHSSFESLISGDQGANSFDEIFSHSTTKPDETVTYQSRDFDRINGSDLASISHAKIQTFKPYSRSKLDLKLVEAEENIQECETPLQSHNTQSISTERQRLKHNILDQIPLKSYNAMPSENLSQIEFPPASEKHKSSHEEIIGFEHNSNEQIYRNEMMLLVETYSLVVNKQQDEINNLKALLEQERKLGRYAKNSRLSDTKDLKIKYRKKFIPMDILVDSEPLRSFNLLPPFKPSKEEKAKEEKSFAAEEMNFKSQNEKSPQNLQTSSSSPPQFDSETLSAKYKSLSEVLSPKPASSKPSLRNSFSSIVSPKKIIMDRFSINSNSGSRVSDSSSSLYFSALEEFQLGQSLNCPNPYLLTPLYEKAEKRAPSISSSESSVMSAPIEPKHRKVSDQNGELDFSNSIGSYTIHSNITTPESLNHYPQEFPKFQS